MTDSIPAHIPIAAGLIIFSIGFYLMSVVDVYTAFWGLVIYTLINRVGLSLAIPSLSISALRSVPPHKLARGASSSTFFRNLGGSFGIAILTAFFQIRAGFHAEALTATQTAANGTTMSFLDAAGRLLKTHGLTEREQIAGALNHLSTTIEAQANILSYQDTFLMISLVALLAAGPAWMIGRGQRND
jgi:DHA2 family multidrug resistance protein